MVVYEPKKEREMKKILLTLSILSILAFVPSHARTVVVNNGGGGEAMMGGMFGGMTGGLLGGAIARGGSGGSKGSDLSGVYAQINQLNQIFTNEINNVKREFGRKIEKLEDTIEDLEDAIRKLEN